MKENNLNPLSLVARGGGKEIRGKRKMEGRLELTVTQSAYTSSLYPAADLLN